jgi:hypothetical protein
MIARHVLISPIALPSRTTRGRRAACSQLAGSTRPTRVRWDPPYSLAPCFAPTGAARHCLAQTRSPLDQCKEPNPLSSGAHCERPMRRSRYRILPSLTSSLGRPGTADRHFAFSLSQQPVNGAALFNGLDGCSITFPANGTSTPVPSLHLLVTHIL